MPFDANGNFSLVPGTIVSDGMTIQPSQHNPPFQDFASGLSQAMVRDGRAPMTGPLNMNGHKIGGVASGDQPGDVITRADISDLAVAIGDGAWSLRDLSPNWLRRDGRLYLRADYPELAALMPALPDGISWDTVPTNYTGTNPIQALLINDDRTVAGASTDSGSSTAEILASVDGAEWTPRATLINFSLRDIAYGNDIYVASSGNGPNGIAISPDGDNWSLVSVPFVFARSVVFVDGAFFCSARLDSGLDYKIYSSVDGSTWTEVFTSATLIGKIFNVNGTIVGLRQNAIVLSTNGGSTWTERSAAFGGDTPNSLAYASGVYVAVGNGGAIFTSSDLTGWISRASGTINHLYSVVGGSTGFVAVGAKGTVRLSSTTGISWAASATGLTSDYRTIILDPDDDSRFIVGGPPQTLLYGVRTQPTQFRVPNDDPTYGWIRAK